ncbi:tetratricopeptide repeat protein [Candidatus Uabimicrobium sp. HlEnr_7]|uniref:tetratricopeptide repeat protein n=1 Tax=Candidatus Uabimicrobium helgolandensis TaxID=3095367 RepID=UPI0035584231
MQYIIGILQILMGIAFSYMFKVSTSNKHFLGLIGTIIFITLNIIFVSSMQLSHPAQLIINVVFIAVISAPWWFFFIHFIGEAMFKPIEFLISPPSGEIQKEYSKARSFEIDGNFERAIAEYKNYFSDKNDYIPLERIGRCYFKMQKYDESLQFLEDAKKHLMAINAKGDVGKKRNEYARLLYIQQLIYKKIKSPQYRKIKAYLAKEYSDTPFVNTNAPQIRDYLQIWANTTVT